MQSSHNQDAMEQQLKETIAAAEQALRQTDEFFDETGIDREKFRDFVAGQMTADMRAEADAQFENDLREIEASATAEKRHLTANAAPVKTAMRRVKRII